MSPSVCVSKNEHTLHRSISRAVFTYIIESKSGQAEPITLIRPEAFRQNVHGDVNYGANGYILQCRLRYSVMMMYKSSINITKIQRNMSTLVDTGYRT